MLNKNKKKNIGIITIAIGLLFVLTANLLAQREKKVEKLQHPYNFEYKVSVSDSCCLEVTVYAPPITVPPGEDWHRYKIIMSGDTIKFFSDQFNNGDSCCKTICPDEYPFTLNIDIIPNHWYKDSTDIYSLDTMASYTPYQTTTFDPICNDDNYEFIDNCCIKILIDSTEYAGCTFDWGIISESGNFVQSGTNREYQYLDTDPVTGKKYIVICPIDDPSEFTTRIVVNKPNGISETIDEIFETLCCKCGPVIGLNDLILAPITIKRIHVDPLVCDGCAFQLEFLNRTGPPEWTYCFDSLNIELYNDDTEQTMQDETYNVSSFNPTDFGIFCMPEGQTNGTITINYSQNAPDSIDYELNNCMFILHFDCKGVIWDTTNIPPPLTIPCTPDCPEAEWIKKTGSMTIEMPPGSGQMIGVTYEFYHRDGCGYQDIQVTDFVYSLPSWQPSDTDENLIFAQIIKDIIAKNEMDFEPFDVDVLDFPNEGICDTTWRVTMGSCWSLQAFSSTTSGTFDPFYPTVIIINEEPSPDLEPIVLDHLETFPIGIGLVRRHKCADVDCCTQRLLVCKERDDDEEIIISVEPIESPDNYFICDNVFDVQHDPDTQIGYLVRCEPMCDWLTELTELMGNGKISINEQNNLAIAKYHLNDYYANEQINISFNSDIQSTIAVHLYDVSGSFITTEKNNFVAGANQFAINTGQLKTGTYYYIIIINNTLIKSNKFVIVR